MLRHVGMFLKTSRTIFGLPAALSAPMSNTCSVTPLMKSTIQVDSHMNTGYMNLIRRFSTSRTVSKKQPQVSSPTSVVALRPLSRYRVFMFLHQNDPRLERYPQARRIAILINKYNHLTPSKKAGLTKITMRLNRITDPFTRRQELRRAAGLSPTPRTTPASNKRPYSIGTARDSYCRSIVLNGKSIGVRPLPKGKTPASASKTKKSKCNMPPEINMSGKPRNFKRQKKTKKERMSLKRASAKNSSKLIK
eukprot:Tbor_TRINITY_DN4052_c0_g2::TRINITY_DN4052_c0_g2_i1::g.11745::m.11745